MNDYSHSHEPLRSEVGGLARHGVNPRGPRLATAESLGLTPREEQPGRVQHPDVDRAALRLISAADKASSVEWTGLAQTLADLASILQALPVPDATTISAALLGND